MKPVIAMTHSGGTLFNAYMRSKYIQSLHRAGAEVRLIRPSDPEKAVAAILQCDGLLIPGGPDVDPTLYGQTPSDKCGKPDSVRDRVELKMLEAFLPTNKPILGICRGVQLLNVFHGGTLYQDIKGTQVCRHSHYPSKSKGCHKVKLYPHTKLGKLIGEEYTTVNSLHHQAADQLGPGLAVSAVSEDGFIEGLEILVHPFCVGVQWHPEHMSKNHPAQQRLFDAFVEACKKHVP